MVNRRDFLARLVQLGVSAAIAPALCDAFNFANAAQRRGSRKSATVPPWPAEYFTTNSDGSVTCGLCPLHETLRPGQTGFCRVRKNEGGKLLTLASGQPCVLNLDPIEKNPLAHALAGQKVLSIAHAGCNMRCAYCQNWQFSQRSPLETKNLDFDQDDSLRLAAGQDIKAVTFTYTEPTSHIEFNKRFAQKAREQGFRTFLCTNGYIEAEPLADFLEVLDGVTVTIKGFSDDFYKEVAAVSRVEPVLDSCEAIRKSGKWLEVATLIVPGKNDSTKELTRIASWIARHLGSETPWHIERFVPKYKLLDLPQTPVQTLERARGIGMDRGLKFVYISNLAPHEANHTYCPKCGEAVIKRLGFKVLSNTLRQGRCPSYRAAIPGVWS